MAKTVILYPSADVSLQHSLYPTSASVGYSLINDVSPDDDTSYISQEVTNTGSQSVTSTFRCDTETQGKIYITGVATTLRSGVSSGRHSSGVTKTTIPITSSFRLGVAIHAGGTTYGTAHSMTSSSSSYNSFTWDNFNDTITGVAGLNTIYQSFTDADIILSVNQTSQIQDTANNETAIAAVTQANVTITYLDVFDCAAAYVPGSGIASVTCSDAEVVDGNTCTFTANLESGAGFQGWYSDAACTNRVSTSRVYTATITDNTTLYAKGDILYNINVYADSNCTVATSKQQATAGESVTVTATPSSARYSIVGWYSNPERTTLVTTDNPYTFTVSGNTNLYAKSKLNEVMYVKINGSWVTCSHIYKKIDGAWVEQDVLDGLFDTTKNYKINEI